MTKGKQTGPQSTPRTQRGFIPPDDLSFCASFACFADPKLLAVTGTYPAGNVSATLKPPSGRLFRLMLPPCASAISRASARPRPVPLRLVE